LNAHATEDTDSQGSGRLCLNDDLTTAGNANAQATTGKWTWCWNDRIATN
jgi:hypothetical protein